MSVQCAGHVLVRRAYAGINASDINYTAGRWTPDLLAVTGLSFWVEGGACKALCAVCKCIPHQCLRRAMGLLSHAICSQLQRKEVHGLQVLWQHRRG